ncbi:MAG: 1-acyl-sn-glycerol-3-phosphate acyltransferase [Treponema sp.]|jgi:1-acyl-sn-glycerol-3-phosphate acyltransferase|nr:1-acyl-sn-glycerol-3-phosphate acyltransferase [Treponema sp.]
MKSLRLSVVNSILKGLVNALCKIDSKEYVEALANMGPAILAINHINFLEVPILVAQSYPIQVTGLAKEETWHNPLFGFIFDTYKAIPIDRKGAYRDVFLRVQEAIEKGFFVIFAPEGTRSKSGVLGKGHAGIVQLAYLTNAPVLPVVHFGGERIWDNLKHLRRTPFRFNVGRPFRFRFDGKSPGKSTREAMLDELMGQMARLLPENMRGPYAEAASKDAPHLEFLA